MANPLETLRKIKGRSWSEIRSRSEQVFSVYAEQAGLSGNLPTDEEFLNLIDKIAYDKIKQRQKICLKLFMSIPNIVFFRLFVKTKKYLKFSRKISAATCTKTS